jgi:uncharacterized membrane protein YhaH (DUF805 family)
MDFWGAIKSGFANYVTFSGRATRSEFWYWILFTVLGAAATSIIDAAMFPQIGWPSTLPVFAPLSSVFDLLTFLPGLAVSVRRLHDLDSRGWWLLIALIPLIGAIVLIAVFCTRGTAGDNRFGPDRLKEISPR